jgi:hypothetical protein
MKRFRLSTLLLLVVVVALCFGLGVQERRAARREAELRARISQLEQAEDSREWIQKFERNRLRQAGIVSQPGGPDVGKSPGPQIGESPRP